VYGLDSLGMPDSIYNDLMIERLRVALKLNKPLTGADAIFYTHEISEAIYVSKGMSQEIAHDTALAKYQVSPYSLYHPEVIEAIPSYFGPGWKQFWVDYKPITASTNEISSIVYQP
jgi:hypothetical protein